MAFARRKKEAAGCSSIVFHPVEKVHCNIFRVNSHHPKKKMLLVPANLLLLYNYTPLVNIPICKYMNWNYELILMMEETKKKLTWFIWGIDRYSIAKAHWWVLCCIGYCYLLNWTTQLRVHYITSRSKGMDLLRRGRRRRRWGILSIGSVCLVDTKLVLEGVLALHPHHVALIHQRNHFGFGKGGGGE